MPCKKESYFCQLFNDICNVTTVDLLPITRFSLVNSIRSYAHYAYYKEYISLVEFNYLDRFCNNIIRIYNLNEVI